MKRLPLLIAVTIVLATAMLVSSVAAVPVTCEDGSNGNCAPNGAHYNLNIIGVENPKDGMPDIKPGGHVIFVALRNSGVVGSKIYLTECDYSGCFEVLDKNGLDSGGAAFQLPAIPAAGDGTCYEIYARPRGAPHGTATMKTCFVEDSTTWCSTDPEYILELTRNHGKQQFTDVTKALTNVMNTAYSSSPVPLFSTGDTWFWDYYNNGLRLAQLRFYEADCPT